MSTPLIIKQVSVDEVIHLRHLVLWPSLPLEGQTECYDTLPTTIHYALYLSPASSSASAPISDDLSTLPEEYQPSAGEGQMAVGIATITLEPYKFPDNLPESLKGRGAELQLHKVAIHPDLQGMGLGKTMLSSIFDLIASSSSSGPASKSPNLSSLIPPSENISNFNTAPLKRIKIDSLSSDKTEKWRYPILLHFDARSAQRGFYSTLGAEMLDPEVFIKQRGGENGVKKEYVRMGILLG